MRYKYIAEKRLRIILLVLASSLVAFGFTPYAHAVGYNLSITPYRQHPSAHVLALYGFRSVPEKKRR